MNKHETFCPPEVESFGATASARTSWLGSVRARLFAWVMTCADNYAAAAAYDDLSRLSDTQLSHRGLSRDILARDLSEGRNQAFESLPSEQPHSVAPSTGGIIRMIRSSFSWDARARGFQTAAVVLVLSVVLAGFVLSLALKDTTITTARSGTAPSTPTIERF